MVPIYDEDPALSCYTLRVPGSEASPWLAISTEIAMDVEHNALIEWRGYSIDHSHKRRDSRPQVYHPEV